ncbi:MAG: sugar ABC transporter permease [Candidatus Sumerlaeia bacterium]|nr:sugar ABC transporter permease [Candidatus Sumerlaeia bacterium]
MTARERKKLMMGLLFTSPWMVGLLSFTVFPAIYSLYYSFCDYSVLNPPVFIGLANYQELLFDSVFWKSTWNTLYFAAIFLPLSTGAGIVLAVLLNAATRWKGALRAMIFVPSLVPLVALGILWRWILNGEYGILNWGMQLVGLPMVNWMGEPETAKLGLVIGSLWGIGNSVVIYLAGLQEIPPSLYEAARVDGASNLQQFRHVTLPMLSPVIYFNVLMGLIGVMQVFALPYVMTDGAGGPLRSTTFYTMYLFDHAFSYLNMGYACAMAWVLFAIIASLSAVAHRLTQDRVIYGAN